MMFVLPRLAPVCLALTLLALSCDGRACSGRLHIEVQNSGVYALDYAAIIAAQPGLKDCPGNDLMLLNHGKEVPIRVHDDGSGHFAAGSRIEWVGQALHGPQSWYDQYSTVNVYLLGIAPGMHARMHELRVDPIPANTVATKPALLRRTQHFEQENLMLRLGGNEMKPGDEPDVWQWAKLTPIDAQPFSYNFDLADSDLTKASGDADVAITLDFRGVSNVLAVADTTKPADHVVEASLNGKLLARFEWEGRGEMRKVLNVARSVLRAQGNTLSLRVPRRDLPGDSKNFIVDVAMFNWLEVSYPVRGNLAASSAPFQATAAAPIELDGKAATNPQLYAADGSYRLLAPLGNDRLRAAAANADVDLYPVHDGQLLSPTLVRPVASVDLRANPADYVIVAHPRLLPAIQPLAQYHREHGHKVAAIDVDDIYDQFNDGIIHPVAIRNLIAWGTQHWAIKPRYLLLVGDASVDIHHDVRDKHRLTAKSFAPGARPEPDQMLMPDGFVGMGTTPYSSWDPALPNRNLIPTWQVPSSSNGQSASDNNFVTLTDGDFHPQLAVGRLPVVEPAEVSAIVAKTIDYFSKPAPGAWHRDVTFISTSEVESFKQESDKIAADLSRRGFSVNNIYTDAKDTNAAHVQAIRATLKGDLDAGNLLVHFLGHGGQYIWRVGPMGDLFTLDDVSAMTNAGRYPMVLAMTCFSAPFDNPTDDSIGERFLREADKGAVAVFAASWSNSPNPQYSKNLIEQLLKPGATIGDAIVATKATLKDREFVEMYNLLGDPALVLARPEGQLSFMRTDDRWNPRVVVRVPAADFGGNVDIDWADAKGNTLSAKHYEARDRQFLLAIPDQAAQVLVYTSDTRSGATAFGSLNLLDPPKPPAPVPRKILAPASKPAATAQVVPAVKRRVDPRDRIAELDFESPPPKAPPRTGADRRQATALH